MKLYIVRHGETDVNLENRINSLNDDDLNENGINQAKKLSNNMPSDYDFIICSPLTRTKHTANIINIKNKPIIYDKRIIERDAGILTKHSLENIDSDDWWNLNPKNNYYDAESVKNVIKRVYEFLDGIKEKYSEKNIVIVTHGGVSKCICAYFKGIPSDGNLEIYRHDNCQIKDYNI